MTLQEIERTLIPELEKDIIYFGNIGFEHLKDKFSRDLEAIKSLLTQVSKEE
jgi:hypothetical protein